MIIIFLQQDKKSVVSLVVVNDPEDAERLAFNHVKKVTNLKPFVLDSIISTEDVAHWNKQRREYQPAFSMNESLKPLIPDFKCSCGKVCRLII